ncbi:MAG: glycosyltransferase [Phycisphaerales bacterium]|nr:glycosyltransferase [Phycisphaerales bacterium]MCB9862485.1 glycosyltransferase [Phycisphaerales bacterium]
MLNLDWKIVLSLPNGLTCGGMTTWAIRTATALARRGRVVVIAAHQPAATLTEFTIGEMDPPPNVIVRRLPSLVDSANWERNLREYTRMLPAVVIPTTHETSFEIAASLAQTTPSIVRLVGWNHSDHDYDYRCLTHIEPICESFIVNTRQCEHELSGRLPHRTAEIHRHPHVIELPGLQRQHRAGDRAIRIGYAGRLEESAKRSGDLIRIASILRDRGVCFTLRIMGDGPERLRIAEGIKRFRDAAPTSPISAEDSNACAYDIELLAPQPPTRMSAFWRDCDCLLLPSAYEGLNFQILEAMSVGCVPVVSEIESGTSELVMHDVNALTFEVGNCDAAANCIVALSESASLRSRLSAGGIATIEQKCQPEQTIADIDAILQHAIESSPRVWPRTTALSMRSADGVQDSETTDAIARMGAAMSGLASNGRTNVAIYGAGRYTRMIAVAFAEAPVTIRAFIDDDPANHDTTLFGWPIVPREQALSLNLDAVIISSRMNENQILRHAPSFAANGIELIPLYAALPTSIANSNTPACAAGASLT